MRRIRYTYKGAMPTTNVRPDCGEQLQDIADVLAKSRKIVVVTGAGISTNCGIPVSFLLLPILCLALLLTPTRIFAQRMDYMPSSKHNTMQQHVLDKRPKRPKKLIIARRNVESLSDLARQVRWQ